MSSAIERHPWLRSIFPAVLAVATTGCAAGWGSAYPGAGARYREYAVYERVDANHVRLVEVRTEESGGGDFGGLVAARAGVGTLKLGGDSFTGTGTDLQVELHYSPLSMLSVGVGAGYQSTSGYRETPEGEERQRASWGRMPLMLYGQLVPLRPFLLRAGAGYFFGSGVNVADEEVTKGNSGAVVSAGASLITPMPGAHFLVGAEWQRARAGKVSTPEGEKELGADQVVLSISAIF